MPDAGGSVLLALLLLLGSDFFRRMLCEDLLDARLRACQVVGHRILHGGAHDEEHGHAAEPDEPDLVRPPREHAIDRLLQAESGEHGDDGKRDSSGHRGLKPEGCRNEARGES
eukprot:4637179-Prymnesium_polylepis.1